MNLTLETARPATACGRVRRDAVAFRDETPEDEVREGIGRFDHVGLP